MEWTSGNGGVGLTSLIYSVDEYYNPIEPIIGLLVYPGANIIITGETENFYISMIHSEGYQTEGTAHVTLKDVKITNDETIFESPLSINRANDAGVPNLYLTLEGKNVLIATNPVATDSPGRAGIDLGSLTNLIIDGDGSLEVRGGRGREGIRLGGTTTSGTINLTIKSGTINVFGGEGRTDSLSVPNGIGGDGSIENTNFEINITGGTVTATGGNASNANQTDGHGIGRIRSMTVSGGTVTAIGGENYDGGQNLGININPTYGYIVAGSFTLDGGIVYGVGGASIVVATENFKNGILFDGNNGTVYGDVVLDDDLTIEDGQTLTIPDGSTLTVPDDKTLTNEGTIIVEENGTIENEGTIENKEDATINNHGTITNGDDGEIINEGIIRGTSGIDDGIETKITGEGKTFPDPNIPKGDDTNIPEKPDETDETDETTDEVQPPPQYPPFFPQYIPPYIPPSTQSTQSAPATSDSGGYTPPAQPTVSGNSLNLPFEPTPTGGYIVTANVAALRRIADGDDGLTITIPSSLIGSVGVTEIVIDNAALKAIVATAGRNGTVSITVDTVPQSKLTRAERRMVGDNPVYEVIIFAERKGERVADLKGGEITLTLRRNATMGDSDSERTVFYRNAEGDIKRSGEGEYSRRKNGVNNVVTIVFGDM